MIELARTLARLEQYVIDQAEGDPTSVDLLIGPHMIDVCRAVIAKENIHDVMIEQMIGWARSRGLLVEI